MGTKTVEEFSRDRPIPHSNDHLPGQLDTDDCFHDGDNQLNDAEKYQRIKRSQST
jgi:hypothetical protein